MVKPRKQKLNPVAATICRHLFFALVVESVDIFDFALLSWPLPCPPIICTRRNLFQIREMKEILKQLKNALGLRIHSISLASLCQGQSKKVNVRASWREMTSVTVPEGLSELLEEFAVTVLREKPSDLLEFASRYFNDLYMSKRQAGGGGQAAGAAVPSPQAVSELASTAEVEMAAEGVCICWETSMATTY